MDGLDDFEKTLAAEKSERERSERDREERRDRKHRHHHRHREDNDRDRERDRDGNRDRDRDREKDRDGHRHRRHRGEDEEGHRSKRSRHSRDDDDEHRSRRRHHRDDNRHEKTSEAKEDLPAPDDEKPSAEDSVEGSKPLVRDAWMSAPSAFEVEHVHRPNQNKPKPPPSQDEAPKRVVHMRELNHRLNDDIERDKEDDSNPSPPQSAPAERNVDYTFGDAGSAWRMTKLKAVYTAAEESGQTVEEIALKRFGSLDFFDDAREEEEEMERRRLYGEGLRTRDKPTGELYQQRMKEEAAAKASRRPEPEQETITPSQNTTSSKAAPTPMDQSALNRLRAQMMKAKLRRAPNAAQLEEEYNRAAAASSSTNAQSRISASDAVVLGVMESRQLAGTRNEVKAVDTKRGRERGLVVENTDMSIEDMVREERRTKGQAGGESLRMAERIAKDGKFVTDLDYMDENAEKLARRVHKSELSLKNMAVGEFQKMSRILESCPLCHKEDQGLPPLAPVVSLGTRVFLTLATEPEVSPGGAVIVPISHRANLVECDDDEWEEIRNFMKSLTRMYHEQGREVLFYENAAVPHRHLHAAMVAVPIPYADGATAPAYFREAFLSADEEWSQHRKIIDTAARAREGGLGRMAFRRSIAKEMPYFHVWFDLDGGMGHVIENADRWPRGDLFAREIIGGIVDAEPHIIKKQGRWSKGDHRLEGWKQGWRKFDWTRLLTTSE